MLRIFLLCPDHYRRISNHDLSRPKHEDIQTTDNGNTIMASLESTTQPYNSHHDSHADRQLDLTAGVIYFIYFFILCFVYAVCYIDVRYPDGFSTPSEEEQRILARTVTAVDRDERTPLIRHESERSSDEEDRHRPPPFWPQARLAPWSVQYYDPEGSSMYIDDTDLYEDV